MKIASALLIGWSLLALSCGSDDDDKKTTATATTTLKYTNVKDTLTSYCVPCHGGAATQGSVDLTTLANAKTHAAKSATALTAGTMPQDSYKTALDAEATKKANLLEWFNAGAPE